ncbi:glucose-1-phosphate adenylyltransferase [Heyndrickxia coagulans]|uniref:glucose-1-phosphate adenylyltransferase n=1 Tax=Heyndrickxia coagulans TaxID=1398 RepID=UPI002EC0804A|nr:glucose-1-phosphate adenylyltransferase [Heyndrickxia coagulans]
MAEKKWMAMLLAGGQGTRLGDLTSQLAKPAVPFGGKYRIIDFSLSNCMHSGIDTVGVLTQYEPHLLNSYVGNGKAWDLDKNFGGTTVLPPYVGKDGGEWYKGTANAVYQNIQYIDHYNPKYVVILSGDHIYKMDYRKLLKSHVEAGAQASIAVMEVPWQEAGRFGIMVTNAEGSIVEFEEKPKFPKSNLASMGVYLFNWKHLREYLIQDEKNSASSHDFGKDIIPKMLKDKKKMYAYKFQGYWKDVGTVQSFWEAHMDLLEEKPAFDLDDPDWRIFTGDANHPPQYIAPQSNIKNALINEGSWIYGDVFHSVISDHVYIGKNSTIRDSVIMPSVTIGSNVTIESAIIASGTVIENGKKITPSKPNDIQLYSCPQNGEEAEIKEVL